MTRSCVLALIVVSVVCGRPAAAQPPPTDAQITKVIERLVSPNVRPKAYPESTGSPDAEYPPGYDGGAQRVVMRAFFALRGLGPAAFPALAKYVGDPRYSFTEDAGEVMSNWSVGAACYQVIESQVQAYTGMWNGTADGGDPRERPRRPGFLHRFSDAELRAWCEARRNTPLREIQIEALEWTIAAEAERPQDFSDKERQYLQDVLAKLRASKEPLPPAGRWAK